MAIPPTPVTAYLASLQKELQRGDATEHTHRSALKTLIESAAPGLLATNEPKATLKTAQLKRYREALPNLLLTNYLDFVWFVGGEMRMEISLGQLNGLHITLAKDAPERWGELIASFLAEITPRVDSPTQLAKNLAGQTRLLRDLSLELLLAGDADLQEQEQSFRALRCCTVQAACGSTPTNTLTACPPIPGASRWAATRCAKSGSKTARVAHWSLPTLPTTPTW